MAGFYSARVSTKLPLHWPGLSPPCHIPPRTEPARARLAGLPGLPRGADRRRLPCPLRAGSGVPRLPSGSRRASTPRAPPSRARSGHSGVGARPSTTVKSKAPRPPGEAVGLSRFAPTRNGVAACPAPWPARSEAARRSSAASGRGHLSGRAEGGLPRAQLAGRRAARPGHRPSATSAHTRQRDHIGGRQRDRGTAHQVLGRVHDEAA